jgi:HlyD family secretion protein
MNRRRLIIGGVLIVLLLAGAVAAYFYFSGNAAARDELLRQLDLETGPAEGELLVSGFIEADEVGIAAEIAGRVVELPFEEGDEVEAGDVLVRLDPTLLHAQRDITQAQLELAEAQRDLVEAGARAEVIAQAQAQVDIAQGSLEGAQAVLGDAAALRNDPQDIQLQIAQAQTQLAVAQQQVGAAQVSVTSAERTRQLFYDALANHQAVIERYGWDWAGAPGQDGPSLGMAQSPRRVDEAYANLNSALDSVDGAQALLDALATFEGDPQAYQAQVIDAQTSVSTAQAALDRARADLAHLEAGPSEEDLAVADAQVAENEAALGVIHEQIARLTIVAPTSGVVLEESIHRGELAALGSPVITLADLDTVKLTVYIPETQLDMVALNQPATVTVDSFPDRTFEGTVTHIADKAEFTPRNVQTREERVNLVFAVKITLANPDHALKPGMPADALFTP